MTGTLHFTTILIITIVYYFWCTVVSPIWEMSYSDKSKSQNWIKLKEGNKDTTGF